jgi:hypothetical protein
LTSKEDEEKILKVKMELAQIIKDMSTARRQSRYNASIPWDKIHIEGYTTSQLQEMLTEIIKTVGRHRTLKEVMTTYKNNHWTYDRKMNSSLPKRPANASVAYFQANMHELKAEYMEKFGISPRQVKH